MYTLSRTFSLLNPELAIDPYPIYKSLRTEAPVYWDEQLQAWLVSRYDDVIDVLGNPSCYTTVIPFSLPDNNEELKPRSQILEMVSKLMDFVEPPNHKRLRGLVEKAFFPKIQVMPGRIQQIVNNLLEAVQNRGKMDIISDFAEPLPIAVLVDLLGTPAEHSTQLGQWGANLNKVIGNVPTTPAEDRHILQNMLAMNDYFRVFLEQRRQEPEDDLITALALVEDQSNKLTDDEILINIGLLLAAGTGTPTYLIGSGLLSLLRHPNQMQKLQDDPSLIKSAVEEFLRYETPLQWAIRFATKDIELGGQFIGKDQTILVGLGSANRDETRFSQPELFDITRQNNSHLAFGYGSHACLGAIFLRMQVQTAINTVLRRLNKLNLATESLEWINAPAFRALKSLPVVFEK